MPRRSEAADAQKIGIMGGTFDPIHNGHLTLARSVAAQLHLDRVLFIPTGNPNFKQGVHISPAEDRVRMVQLAIEDEPTFELDRCEVDRPGVTYSIDTLKELHARYPGARFYFIMGADSAKTIVHWKAAEELASLCTVVVTQRPGYDFSEVRDLHGASPIDFDVVYLETPPLDVSSTELRERISCGLYDRDMLPPAVMAYIEEHDLYR